MKILYRIISIAIWTIVISCAKEATLRPKIHPENFIASTESIPDISRTSLQGGTSIIWSKGDRIVIFDKTDIGQAYVLDDNYAGLSSGKFSIIPDISTEGNGNALSNTIAYYPYNGAITIKQDDKTYSINNVMFSHEQKYYSDGPSMGSFPMLAICDNDDKTISFKNIGGIIRISLTGTNSISKITLTGHNNEKLSGSATVTMSAGDIPRVQMDETSYNNVSVICDPAKQLSETIETHFYISVPPATLDNGFTITIEYSNGCTITKSTNRTNSVKRSSVLKMPVFKERPTSGQCIDLGLSVKWAGWNIGATSAEEDGYLYAWGEIEPKSTYSFDTYLYYNNNTGKWSHIGDDISGTQYDVAHVKWGNGWRMPTLTEAEELIENCMKETVEFNNVYGELYVGPNGNSIFLPYVQTNNGNGWNDAGYYWTSTYDDENQAYYIQSDNGGYTRSWYKSIGMPVRPVKN